MIALGGEPDDRHRQQKASAGFSRINLHEEWEIRYWTGRWSVSRDQLMETVKRVGVQVADVARALGKAA